MLFRSKYAKVLKFQSKIASLVYRYLGLLWVHQMSDTHSPQANAVAVRLLPHPFMVLDVLNTALADVHFFSNACEPNQKATMDAQINWVSLSHN